MSNIKWEGSCYGNYIHVFCKCGNKIIFGVKDIKENLGALKLYCEKCGRPYETQIIIKEMEAE